MIKPRTKEEEMMILEKDFIGIDNDNCEFYQDILTFDEHSDLPFIEQPKICSEKPNKQTQLENENGNYQALQNRILELEARIHDLEFEKQSSSIQNTNSTVSNSIFSVNQNNNNNNHNEYKIKINDFSPEWDFVEGGSKMMICYTPNQLIPTDDQNNKLIVIFGDVEAKAFCIQPGVIRCYGINVF